MNIEKTIENLYKNLDPYITPESFPDSNSSDYGETDPRIFSKLLSRYKRREDRVFYDLGSGIGKLLFYASLFYSRFHGDFSKVIGIEHDRGRHGLALEALNTASSYGLDTKKIIFRYGDFTSSSFQDGDLIYVNAEAFTDVLMQDLSSRLELLSQGSRVIIAERKLGLDTFSLHKQDAGFYIYDKNR